MVVEFCGKSHKTVNDKILEFLMEVMELNETINDNEDDREVLSECQMEFNEKKRLLVRAIDEKFKNQDLDGAREKIAELNYIERTLHLIDNKLHNLDLKENRVKDSPCDDCEHKN